MGDNEDRGKKGRHKDATTRNAKGVSNARRLIRAGRINTGAWSFSAGDGNKLLGPDGDDWAEYGRWFLAVDSEAEPDTKAHYKYPFGKNGQIYRRGVIAAKGRATQQGLSEIASVADNLLQAIDSKLDEANENLSVDNGSVRFDQIDGPDWMVRPFELTSEGYLKGRAVVTNVGVFLYQNPDGTVRRELRLPEDVFSSDSTETLKLKPVTNNHPMEAVVSDNARRLEVGSTGSSPSKDPFGFDTASDYKDGGVPGGDRYHLSIDMVIRDPDAVQDVMKGKRALSCAYHTDIEPTAGVWMGVPYDGIQRNIRYNHVAIVNRSRAGDAAQIKLRMDSHDAVCVGQVSQQRIITSDAEEEDKMGMKTIKLDGVDYQAEETVVRTLNAERKRADDLEVKLEESAGKNDQLSKDIAELQGKHDALKDRLDKAEERLKDSASPEKIAEAVKFRISLEKAAGGAGVEIKEDMSDVDIKTAVVLKAFPDIDKDLLKDESYLSGRFDGAVELLKDEGETEARARGSLTDGLDGNRDSATARREMIERNRRAYLREDESA